MKGNFPTAVFLRTRMQISILLVFDCLLLSTCAWRSPSQSHLAPRFPLPAISPQGSQFYALRLHAESDASPGGGSKDASSSSQATKLQRLRLLAVISAVLPLRDVLDRPATLLTATAPMLLFSQLAEMLKSAAARNRLEGNTFKIINLGLLLSSLATVAVHLMQTLTRNTDGLIDLIGSVLVLSQTLFACVPILREYGPPRMKLERNSALSSLFMVSRGSFYCIVG